MAGPWRGGEGKGPGHYEKQTFFNLFFQRSNDPTPILLEGEGLGLNGPAIKRRTWGGGGVMHPIFCFK